jgi:hypothetical protein
LPSLELQGEIVTDYIDVKGCKAITSGTLIASAFEIVEIAESANLVHVITGLLNESLSAILGEVLQKSKAL